MSEFLLIYFAAALSAALFLVASMYPKIRTKLRRKMSEDLTLVKEVQPMLDHYLVVGFMLGINFFLFMPKYIGLILFDHQKQMYIDAYVSGVTEK
jgi:hypothetical protein